MTASGSMEATFPSFDCFTATYGTALVRAGWDPVVLGDQWGYGWDGGPPDDSAWPLNHLAISHWPLEETLRYWYGIDVDVVHHPSSDAAWSYVCVLTDQRRPVVVTADAFHLPYSPHFHKVHLPHRVLVTGRRGDRVSLVDSYRGAQFAGLLPAADVRRAMAAIPADHTGRDCTSEVMPPQEASPCALHPDAVRDAVRDNALRYLGPGDLCGEAILRRVISGIRAFARDGGRLREDTFLTGVMYFGELASQRTLNAAFLLRAAAVLRIPSLRRAAELAEDASEGWMTVRNVFFLRVRSNPGSALARVADRMDALAESEARMSTVVVQAVGTGAVLRSERGS